MQPAGNSPYGVILNEVNKLISVICNMHPEETRTEIEYYIYKEAAI